MSFAAIFEGPHPHIVMNEVLKIGDPVVKPPRAISAPDPLYTKAARNAQIEGNVHLWVMRDEHGVPQQVWIDKSLDSGPDQSAVDTVKK
jgi:hypothetical protein